MNGRSCFRTSFRNQRVNGSHTLQNSAKGHFYLRFPSFSLRQILKRSLLVRSEILGLYVNEMSADVRDYRLNTGQFTITDSNAFILKAKSFLWILKSIFKT